MTNILYLSPSAGIGGTETFLKQTFLHTDDRQFKNHYLLFDQGPLYNFLSQHQASVYVLKPRPRLSKIRDWTRVQNKIKDIIEEKNIHLVHSSMSYAALFAAKACKQTQCPHVWFQHGPTTGWMDQLAAVLNHQGFISNSKYTQETQLKLEKKFNFLIRKNRKLLTLHLGTEVIQRDLQNDLNYKKKIFEQYQLKENTLIISMLCRIQHWKGVHLLVEACKKIRVKEESLPIHFIIWGEAYKGDHYLKSLIQDCNEFHLPIEFAGLTSNPNQALAISDLLINASVEPEPFGLSIIEALSVGTPALVPNEGGPSEIIKDQENGLHFKARDSDSLAQKIIEFVKNKELQNRLSANSIESAKKDFNVEDMMRTLEQFYKSFLLKS